MSIKKLKTMIKEALAEESILLEKPDLLEEASFNRVKKKIEEQNIPFAMLTAFRGVDKEAPPVEQDKQRAENNTNMKQLKARLKAAGFSWVDMRRSGYKEGGTEGTVVEEYSVLAWDQPRGDVAPSGKTLFETARSLANDYKQDSFIYGGPDLDNPDEYTIRLYTSTGEPIKDVWAGGTKGYTEIGVVEDAEAEYWSMIDHKKTQFKEMYDRWKEFKPKSRLEAMKKQHYLKLAERKIKEIGTKNE